MDHKPAHNFRMARTVDPDELPKLHPIWQEFIRYCQSMGYGEIERLSIQDGLPVLAEKTRTKVKFTR
jgi:hypothetical protein